MAPGALSYRDSEVMDVDEEAYRVGTENPPVWDSPCTGSCRKDPDLKQVFEESDEERAKGEIARFIHEIMIPDVLYILGAGTTTESIARRTW